MKLKIDLGNGIWREETPEETLIRRMRESGNTMSDEEIVKIANLSIALDKQSAKAKGSHFKGKEVSVPERDEWGK